MKTNSSFKIELIGLLFVALSVLAIFSCKNNSNAKEDSTTVAEEHNDAKFNDSGKSDDSQFLVDAAEISQVEIELGKLAQNQGKMADVKELGKKMENDHSKALADVRSLAAKKQVTLPASLSDDGKSKYKSLSERSGIEFDKAYCDAMVEGHEDAIKKFEDAAKDSQDTEVKAWANSMLPTLRTHLDHAMMCQKKIENLSASK